MRRFTLVFVPAVMLAGSMLVSSDAQSQFQSTQDKDVKIKVKGDRVVERDKSKPVWRALEQMYARIADAQRNEDIDALRATRTPDFTVDLPNGQRWDLETSLNYSRAGFQQVESNISISNAIESLDVHDDVAVAVVHQRWSRMQMKAGKVRRVDTEAIQTETWVNTPDGWRLKQIGARRLVYRWKTNRPDQALRSGRAGVQAAVGGGQWAVGKGEKLKTEK